MPLNANNTPHLQRGLYAGQTKTVQILKRQDDQRQGSVVKYTIFDCRRSAVHKAGEPIQGEMMSYHRTTWHIPMSELQRVGIHHINPADRIYDPSEGRYWQPESPQTITEKLFGTWCTFDAVRIDPPNQSPSS